MRSIEVNTNNHFLSGHPAAFLYGIAPSIGAIEIEILVGLWICRYLLGTDQASIFHRHACNNYYQLHTISKHGLRHPCYPSSTDIGKLKLNLQGKKWEV
jgi:hypothetical protein